MAKYLEDKRAIPYTVTNVAHENIKNKASHFGFSIYQEYINTSKHELTVVTRNGIKFSIPHNNGNRFSDEIIIRVVVEYDSRIKMCLKDALEVDPAEAKLLQEVCNTTPIYHGGKRRYALDYTLTIGQIESQGDSLYLNNLDVVVSTLSLDYTPPHPFSKKGIRVNSIAHDEDLNNYNQLAVVFKLVDNAGKVGLRYINFNSRVYRIPVVQDTGLQDGLYIHHTGLCSGGNITLKPDTEYYTLADLDTVAPVYKSYEEALTRGDEISNMGSKLATLTMENKLQVEQQKTENIKLTMEYQKYKIDLEKEQAEYKLKMDAKNLKLQEQYQLKDQEQSAMITELKIRQAKMEHERSMESLYRKDQYEAKSYVRKDTSEFLKFIPTIITSVTAIITLVVLKSKT